jgi:hypothetical protein
MKLLVSSLVALLWLTLTAPADLVGSAFTYQGRLDHNGAPANGPFDLKFELFDAAANGNAVGAPVELFAKSITNGLLAADLDFGGPAVINGTAYWLAVSARAAGTPNYVPVPGRQAVRPTPYAIHALSAGAVSDGSITGSSLADGAVTTAKLAPSAVGLEHLSAPNAPVPGHVLGFDGATLVWGPPGAGDGIWTRGGTLAYYTGGDVAIGTAAPNPGYRLSVQGGAQLTGLGLGGTLQFGTPNSETGMTITGTARADLRFDGATLKLVAGPAGGPPSLANGIVIDTAGRVGMGGTPASKLHVRDAVSVTQLIETDGGTNAWSRLSLKNANGQWDVGTSRNFNGDQLYIYRTGSPNIQFGVQPNGDTFAHGDVIGTRLVLRRDPAAPTNAAVICGDANVTNFVPYNTATNRALNIVASDASVVNLTARDTSVRVLTIRGGADLAEPFAMSHDGVEPGSVVVIDEKNPGKLKQSTRAYDKKVAGIVSGANGIQPGISMIDEERLEAGKNVALSGRVYVKADTSAGRIEPGDLLTTSAAAGRAMKASNHAKAQGAILGKAMTRLDAGRGMVLVLVTLQ